MVRTRKRGKTYSYIFEAGKNSEGKRKVVEKGGFYTKADAYNAGIEAYNNWKHGNIGIISERVLFKDFYLHYLDSVVAQNVRNTTLGNYVSRFKSHISPFLGNIAVQDIKPMHIANFVNNLAANDFSHGYITNIINQVSASLRYAVYPCELIDSNPAEAIKIPRSCPRNIVKRNVVSDDDIIKYLKAYPVGHHYHIVFQLLLHTGMRLGEVFGLCWDNIHLDSNPAYIEVKEQKVYRRNPNGYYFSDVKTATSNRIVLLDKNITMELKTWHKQQKGHESHAGDSCPYVYCDTAADNRIYILSKCFQPPPSYIRKELVCTNQECLPFARESFTASLRLINTNAHSLRHTHASILIANGAKIAAVSARLGHKNLSITLDTYTHDTPDQQMESLKILDKICRQS